MNNSFEVCLPNEGWLGVVSRMSEFQLANSSQLHMAWLLQIQLV